MNKQVVEEVLERSKGLCELCGSNNQVELHHIVYGSGKRTQLETPESVIALCYEHHKGNYGVHGKNGSYLNTNLKRTVQGYYKAQGKSEEEIRTLMGGRLY